MEYRISASTDDVEERASGSVKFTSSDLELVDDNPTRPGQTIGLRFNGLDIPQGAIITSAYIQFQVDEVDTGAATLQIHGEDTDNAEGYADRRADRRFCCFGRSERRCQQSEHREFFDGAEQAGIAGS